ncbi:MAG TPA: hypothetical protein RMH99_11790, partial [Sandaracinaceae bacterium LLY-WYZ-13_1]|nr:hypothetical protein [Sandaracinaceae bacterium LLY-WYZ-13_1]
PTRLAAVAPAPSGARCTTRGPFESPSAAAPRGARLALADTRRCDRPSVPAPPAEEEAAEAASSAEMPARLRRHEGPRRLPEQSLLSMLRQRIVPVARGCFRDDRAGRASYQTRAVYEFRLADREVIDASVEGRIDDDLRRCLARAIDDLEIPRFDGTVRVRYPIYTAPRMPPPTLSLDPDVADVVDAIVPEADETETDD